MGRESQRVDQGVIWFTSPLGTLVIQSRAGALVAVDILAHAPDEQPTPDAVGELACAELAAYFADGRHCFRIPLYLAGTPFQQAVWQALQTIPPGQVVTYGGLARRLSSSPRAIGNACRRNPCPILVPCHRVVAAHGLGGYDGRTDGPLLERKRWLLRHEGAIDG